MRGSLQLILLAGALAGCGANAAGSEPVERKVTVSAAANGALRFEPAAIETKAGRVAIAMDNPSSIPHAVALRGHGGGDVVDRGGTSHFVADLEPGTYRLYCPVGSHEKAGMVARLRVR